MSCLFSTTGCLVCSPHLFITFSILLAGVSYNYTKLTPANDNISIPYTPIEYIIDIFEMFQL